MFWIHGGGFASGASDEGRHEGASLAARGVVIVEINYRMAIFGFLAHPELAAESPTKSSGNYGLLDQIAALRWVRENIARVWRQSEQRHDLRRVGGIVLGERADGVAVDEGTVSQGDRPERRLLHECAATSGPSRCRGGRGQVCRLDRCSRRSRRCARKRRRSWSRPSAGTPASSGRSSTATR